MILPEKNKLYLCNSCDIVLYFFLCITFRSQSGLSRLSLLFPVASPSMSCSASQDVPGYLLFCLCGALELELDN